MATMFEKKGDKLSEEELLRRLPEIELIQDNQIRDSVIQTFQDHCPDYFWEVPASSSGKYHQTDVTNEQGLLLHTKRAFTVAQRICDSATYQGLISEEEQDILRASILLHDLFKQGLEPRDSHHTSDNHDRLAKEYLERKTELDPRILECIDSHNGGWGEGKKPENNLEQLHHMADMVGSDRNIITKVYKPCEEIENIFDKALFNKEGIKAEF